MGCGLAYHLALEGWHDVVLLEKSELTSGSTWHAAGQITHSISSFSLGKCVDYNIRLYAGDLEADTGHAVGWHGCGSLRLAYCEDELDWLGHTLSIGKALGFRMEILGPERIAELHPFYRMDGIRGALHTPDDGHVDPSGVTLALAAGARARGVRILRRCRVTGLQQLGSGEWLVTTEKGPITCEHVVNAAGAHARQIGTWTSSRIPAVSMTHHYLVTETVPEFEALETELPVVRDDRMVSGYVRMEQRSGLIGIYEKSNPRSVWEDGCPWEVESHLFSPDYDRIMPWLENALDRVPILANLGIKRSVHGAISHPPDGNPLIGPTPALRNYWCCCGTQIGVGWGPGLTRELARWMVHGAADISMRAFDPRRFGDHADNFEWQTVKAREDYCLRHEIPYPHFNRLAGRPQRPSPLYDCLRHRGAVFEDINGHERPRWFAPEGIRARDQYGFRRNPVHDIVGEECRRVRDAAGVMDISAFAKVEISGPDAERFMDGLSPNRLPCTDGRIFLTHFLNRRGRIELEVCVVRRHARCFYVTCAAFFEQRLLDHLNHARGLQDKVTIRNLTDSWSALAINGPQSRAILGRVTDSGLSNAAFPWLAAREIRLAGWPVLALRMSYAGELGWELHAPRDAICAAYEALASEGRDLGISDYGSFAMNALRMEKGFPGAGELTNEVTLPEAGLMRFVDIEKSFVGKDKTLRSLHSPLPWVCAFLEVEDDGVNDGHGGEAVLWRGRLAGSITSIAYGYRVDRILAFAYLRPDAARDGDALQIVIMGETRRARVLTKAAYDPENLLPRTDG